jgi:hypothetical protein
VLRWGEGRCRQALHGCGQARQEAPHPAAAPLLNYRDALQRAALMAERARQDLELSHVMLADKMKQVGGRLAGSSVPEAPPGFRSLLP